MVETFKIHPYFKNKRIAVIGAGPSGAIALDSFLKRGFSNVTVFERRGVAGGTWSLDEHIGINPESIQLPIGKLREQAHPPSTVPDGAEVATFDAPLIQVSDPEISRFDEGSLYPSVETNILAHFMAFTNKPFKPQTPPCQEKYGDHHDFRTHDVIREYVLEYFEGRESHLQFNTTVERAYQPNGPGSAWKLFLRQHRHGDTEEKWWVEEFDYIYAASGRFSVPRIPDIPGLEDSLKGLPKNTVLHTKTYRDPEAFRDKSVLLVGASWSSADVAHAIADICKFPLHLSFNSVRQHALPAFKQPFIEAHGGISKVAPNASGRSLDVTFKTGETIEGIEKIVFGTGYHLSYPYLSEYLKDYGGIWRSEQATSNLYWTTWWKYDHSLAVSSIITDGITWRALEAQARATSYLWAGYPGSQPFTLEQAEQWEKNRVDLNLLDFHLWYPKYPELIAGITIVGTGEKEFPDGEKIDTSSYNDWFVQSLQLKGEQWSIESKRRLAKDPSGYRLFEKTGEQLEARKIAA